VLNPVWVLFFLGERPGPLALLGGAIVLGAVVVRSLIALRMGKIRPVAVP
jgi:drug/metabolite transporter (DMT)-like permease